VAVIVLRFREPRAERPYRVLLYPLPPLVFAAVCAWLIYSGATYKPLLAGVACGLVLLGLPVYGLTRWLARRAAVER
jgi:APA family basic amino acid/polyamine antiporter